MTDVAKTFVQSFRCMIPNPMTIRVFMRFASNASWKRCTTIPGPTNGRSTMVSMVLCCKPDERLKERIREFEQIMEIEIHTGKSGWVK